MEPLDTIPTAQAAANHTDFFGRMIYVLALLALFCAPTQLTLMRHHHPLPLALAEIFLLLAFGACLCRMLVLRKVEGLPPFTLWLLIIAGVLSVVGILAVTADNTDKLQALPELKGLFAKEMLKYVLYLLFGVMVFRTAFTSRQRVRSAMIVLLVSTSLAVLLAVGQRMYLQQHYQPDATLRASNVFDSGFTLKAYRSIQTPIGVCSTFGSWNDHGFHASREGYAGFLGLVLPFALALLVLEGRRKGLLVWLSLLFVAVAVTLLAGYLVPGILIGLIVTGVAMGWKVARYVLLAVVVYLLLLFIVREPVPITLAHSPASRGFHGFNYSEVLLAPFQLKISAEDAANPNLLYNNDDGHFTRHLKKFWGEQLAALRLMRGTTLVPSPQGPALFGVGLGTYQAKGNIQDGFSECISPVANQHLESDAQSGYLLMLVSTGVFGLAAMLAVMGTYIAQAWRPTRSYRGDPWSAALLGAMVAFTLMSLCTNLWIRGSFIIIAMLFALLENRALLVPEKGTVDSTQTNLKNNSHR
jgi:hypothetical protein